VSATIAGMAASVDLRRQRGFETDGEDEGPLSGAERSSNTSDEMSALHLLSSVESVHTVLTWKSVRSRQVGYRGAASSRPNSS
jgi:hypothetical protein